MNYLRSLLVHFVTIALVLLFAPIAIVTAPVRGGRTALWLGWLWSTIIMSVAGVRIQCEGEEHIRKDVPQVFVANHQGNFDIFVLARLLRHVNFRFLAKKELFRIPIFGWALHAAGFPRIDRGNSARARGIMEDTERMILEREISIGAFPEGTRNTKKGFLPFKKGAFVMAIKLQIPVVPIVINGSRRVQFRRAFCIKPGVIRVTVLEPVSTDGRNYKDRNALIEVIRERMLEKLDPEDQAEDGLQAEPADPREKKERTAQ